MVEAATGHPELTVRENLEVTRLLQAVNDRSATALAIERWVFRNTPTAAPVTCDLR
jgi:hypothetical protein